MKIHEVEKIIDGRLVRTLPEGEVSISNLMIDTRKVAHPASSIFFAIKGPQHDGHDYLEQAYRQGVRAFVVSDEHRLTDAIQADVLKVDDVVQALQLLVAHHRAEFSIPVIGITGSNGKTQIKEWLAQLLQRQLRIVRSPKSYNSQVGVPLSVWPLGPQDELGIFEAGISERGEMRRLERVIRPTIGLLTNIGTAHDSGFSNWEEKLEEKLQLFSRSEVVVYCKDHEFVDQNITSKDRPFKTFTWGKVKDADIHVVSLNKKAKETEITLDYQHERLSFWLPFVDNASIENCLHCLALAFWLGLDMHQVGHELERLRPIAMRMELKQGVYNSQIIDDSYNNDLAGLRIALDFMNQQGGHLGKALILSDVLQSSLPDQYLYAEVATLLKDKHVEQFIGIGPALSEHKNLFPKDSQFYDSTAHFLQDFDRQQLASKVVLIKGARAFKFEQVVKALQLKVHRTVLEVDLDALANNLNYYRSLLEPSTKVMVMVKAFAYGSGSLEVARFLEFNQVDYLAVAYADEGIRLRENGISLPIMVMNPPEGVYEQLAEYRLEAEVYSFGQLQSISSYFGSQCLFARIHIKLDTGMHRLGFAPEQIDELVRYLKENPHLKVCSAFTHLSSADEPQADDFTREQLEIFSKGAKKLEKGLGYSFLKHALNSAGIKRFGSSQFDMVRLGIGLYGVGVDEESGSRLQRVSTLKTSVTQVKNLKAGTPVGYGRKGVMDKDGQVATIAIGYADGFDRRFSNGVGKVVINGHMVPVIGNVCMDMTMVDVTGLDVKEGDEVIIFGKSPSLGQQASAIGTIPYELLTNVGERVKRVFFSES